MERLNTVDMAEKIEIESTLVFDTDKRFTGFDDQRELIAEGIHKSGDRSIRAEYVRDKDTLIVRRYYRYERERLNQVRVGEWNISDNSIEYNGQQLDQFVCDMFHNDPEAALSEEYESVV